MSEFRLTAPPALEGYSGSFPGAELVEVTDLALVSIAAPLGGREALDAALQAGFGAGFPVPGATAGGEDGAVRLLGVAPDQALAVLAQPEGLGVETIGGALGGAAYCTEQTDAWVILRLSGPRAVAALERICPLDLHPAAFPEGQVARTVMEHLGVIVLREGSERFLLMSARSSARSFLHALETSIRNVG